MTGCSALPRWIVSSPTRAPLPRGEALPFMDAVVVEGSSAAARELQGRGFEVAEDRWVPVPSASAERPDRLNTGKLVVGASAADAAGFRGKGIGVVLLDTGCAPHAALKKHIMAFKDIINGEKQPYDDNGHGTHVAGIVGASGGMRGVAPECGLIPVKVLTAAGGRVSDILKGIQWAVDNRARFNIRVLNMSFGVPVNSALEKDPLAQAVEKANAAGLLCVVAAGNDGPSPGSVSSPGRAPSALTVGALDDGRTLAPEDDVVSIISGRGPTNFEHEHKPDLVAPGVRILSTSADGGTEARTGTSMATPFVAGAAALLFGQEPGRTPAQVKELLSGSAVVVGDGSDLDGQGHGTLRVDRALGIAR